VYFYLGADSSSLGLALLESVADLSVLFLFCEEVVELPTLGFASMLSSSKSTSWLEFPS